MKQNHQTEQSVQRHYRWLSVGAFVLGAIVIVWMALGFLGTNALAFLVTVVIGAVYVLGCVEQWRFRQATLMLDKALNTAESAVRSGDALSLERWLDRVPSVLRNSVRTRIEGERVTLPAAVLTPYFVGLLVMLGLIGTFVGMVVTLQGAVVALSDTTDLQAVRSGLAAPIGGLALAFGTSVAGVAASAMLGLISALNRHERLNVVAQLDRRIATTFRDFSLYHQRKETFAALQSQSTLLPSVTDQLLQLADKMEHMTGAVQQMADAVGDKLSDNQTQFYDSVTSSYQQLAQSVEQSLRSSISDSERATRDVLESTVEHCIRTSLNEGVKPMVEHLLGDVREQARQLHQQVGEQTESQMKRFSEESLRFTDSATQSWQSGVTAMQQSNDELLTQLSDRISAFHEASDVLLQTRKTSEEQWAGDYQQRMDDIAQRLSTELTVFREQEARRGDAAVERLADLESHVVEHLSTLGQELETPMLRLIETASETPKAAAEVIEKLKAQMSESIERDNGLLQERQALMGDLTTLLQAAEQTTVQQQQAIESLVESSGTVLKEVSVKLTDQMQTEVEKIHQVADQFAESAIEISTLGETFGVAVNIFNESNQSMMDNLNRIESSLDNVNTRNDDQLAYYVAQAREIIDHSMTSQKAILDEWRELKPEPVDFQISETETAEVEEDTACV